jgi:hypothetical protein
MAEGVSCKTVSARRRPQISFKSGNRKVAIEAVEIRITYVGTHDSLRTVCLTTLLCTSHSITIHFSVIALAESTSPFSAYVVCIAYAASIV